MIDCIDWKLQSIDVDPMISSRWRLAGCAISTRSVIVCGGRTNDKVYQLIDLYSNNRLQVLTDTYLLTIEDDGHLVCQQLADLPIALHSHSCIFDAVHQRVLLTGGLIDWHCTSSTIYEYDIQLGIWRRLADSDDTARYGHTSHLIDNRLLIVGGSRPDHGATDAARSVVIIQMDTTITTTVLMIDDQHRNCLVNHDSALLTDSHRLVTIGGGGNFFSFGTFFNGTISSFDMSQVDYET
jgi:tRNA wybutosine-synthesizing protein 4